MRNYKELNSEEKKALEKFKKENEETNLLEKEKKIRELRKKYPAIINYKSLFPNQLINPYILFSDDNFNTRLNNLKEFIKLIENQKSKERDVLKFIKDEKLFIIASIIKKNTSWGHHDLYVFKEFPLGTKYKTDYLIVGKNSSGFHFMFVELENIYGKITLKDGSYGDTIRKGKNQVLKWEEWIDSNFYMLINDFNKHLNLIKTLPKEFREYDTTRISYAVIAGRRTDYKEFTYSLRRKENNQRINILHYDNLVDYTKEVIKYKRF